MDVFLDELVQTFGIEAGHVAHDVDQPMGFEIPALVRQAFEGIVLGLDRFEFDHRQVAAAFENRPARPGHRRRHAAHPGGEIAPGIPEAHDDATGHVFATVVADALDHTRPRLNCAPQIARPATPRK